MQMYASENIHVFGGFFGFRFNNAKINASVPYPVGSAITVDFVDRWGGFPFLAASSFVLLRGGRIRRAIAVNEPLKSSRATTRVQRKPAKTFSTFCSLDRWTDVTRNPSLRVTTVKVQPG